MVPRTQLKIYRRNGGALSPSLDCEPGCWGPGWYLARGRSTMNSEGMSYYLMATEGWMDGRVDEWMEEWVDGWRGEWVSG